MNDERERDAWKEALRKKLQDAPLSGTNDDQLWANLRSQIQPAPQPGQSKWAWFAAAASIVVLLGAGAFFYQQHVAQLSLPIAETTVQRQQPVAVQEDTFQVAPSQALRSPEKKQATAKQTTHEKSAVSFLAEEKIASYVLDDGSVVTLNKSAILEVTSDFAVARNVTLQGEAYFDISPDKNKPFSVTFGGNHLVVLGTKFNVRSLANNEYEITVTEGLVKVFDKNGNTGTEVSKGRQLLLTSVNKPRFTNAEVQPYVLWTNGHYDFHKSKLSDIANVLSRRFALPVEISPEIENCRFTGDLSDATEEEALEILKTSLDLTVVKKEETYFISGQACE